MCEYIDMLEARGQKRGEERGERRLLELIQLLLKEKKYVEIDEVSRNKGRRMELYQLYGI